MAHEHARPGVVVDLNTFGQPPSTALVKEREFETIRMELEAENKIRAHKVDGPITVQCLIGACTFFVDGEPRELVTGSWLYLAGGTMHALAARERCVVIVTIIFPRRT